MKSEFFRQYPYLCDTFFISKNTKVEQSRVDAKELLSPYRLDFMAKLLWIDALYGKFDKKAAEELYRAHLLAFSHQSMTEPGQPEKKGFQSYCDRFYKICAAAEASKGAVLELGNPIPIDGKDMAMDGAHRISAAVYYEKKVPVYLVAKKIPNQYDYRFFRKRYLSEKYLLEMAEKYVSMRECRLYLLNRSQKRKLRGKRMDKECQPVYRKKLPQGGELLLVDVCWIEKYKNPRRVWKLLGEDYIEGEEAILEKLKEKKAVLLQMEIGYAWKKRIGMRLGAYQNQLRVEIKRRMGKPV